MMNVSLTFDRAWNEEFLHKIDSDGPWANKDMYKLSWEAANHLAIPEFTGLQAPKHLPHVQLLPHQIETAKTVVEDMNGKAILADEVGLGKTIEAGLILKEYMIRGIAKKILILVPASLVSQWTIELNQKFFIPAVGAQKKSYVWEQCEVVVSSLDTAKRDVHWNQILQQNYDIIIIDEAHKLKNHKTKNYALVRSLKKRFCLLLSATPVQNKPEEIFNLISLLKPGHLGSHESFTEDFRSGERELKNEKKLRQLVDKVMVRNRRRQTDLPWPERNVENVTITMNKEERALYEAAGTFTATTTTPFLRMTLQREICSSREAALLTLQKMFNKNNLSSETQQEIQQLGNKIEAVQTNSKAEKALSLINDIEGKVILFTEYRATQLFLQWFLKQHGITSVPYRGGFKRSKKDWMRQLFQNKAKVLVATEAGGEGINLQFCQHIINYDLPWNPMRIEQRIGRIHRIGQERDVTIYNFATQNTVEEHILHLLYDKIHLFENVIGEIDEILTRLDMTNIEKTITDIFTSSQNEGEVKVKMNNLSSLLEFEQNAKKEATADGTAGHS